MMTYFLSLVLLFQTISIASAFVAPVPTPGIFDKDALLITSPRRSLNPMFVQSQQPSKVQLWSQDENENSNDVSAEETTTVERAELESRARELFPQLIQQTFMLVSNMYSVFIIALSTYLMFGLLLNFCGYGYYFNQDGYQVDTLEHMRMEKQIEREFQRMTSQSQPPSSLPN